MPLATCWMSGGVKFLVTADCVAFGSVLYIWCLAFICASGPSSFNCTQPDRTAALRIVPWASTCTSSRYAETIDIPLVRQRDLFLKSSLLPISRGNRICLVFLAVSQTVLRHCILLKTLPFNQNLICLLKSSLVRKTSDDSKVFIFAPLQVKVHQL